MGSQVTRYFPITSSIHGTIAYLVSCDAIVDFRYLGGSAYGFYKATQPTGCFAVHYQPNYDSYVTFGIGNAGPSYITQWISACEITG